jgi:hypothetical protein
LSIVEELPLPLPATGFLALADFFIHHVALDPTPVNTSAALRSLAALVVQVETNFKVHHFRSVFKDFFTRALTEQASLDSAGRAAIYNLLKGLVVMNPMFAIDFFEDGALELAMGGVVDGGALLSFGAWAAGDEAVFVALLGFLVSMLVFGDDVQCALCFRGLSGGADAETNRRRRIRPEQLLPPPAAAEAAPAAFQAAVQLCALLYGSRLIDDADESESTRAYFREDRVEYVRFVDAAMRGALALLELYGGEGMLRACGAVCLLSRHSEGILGMDCHGPIGPIGAAAAGAAAGATPAPPPAASVLAALPAEAGGAHPHPRLTLTDIIASCRGLLVEYLLDDLENFDLDYACVVDALAVLSGWSFSYWDPLSSNKEAAAVLNEEEVREVVSVISAQMASPSASIEKGENVERKTHFASGTSLDMVSPDALPDNEDTSYSTADPEILDMIVTEKKKRKTDREQASLSLSLSYQEDTLSLGGGGGGGGGAALSALQGVLQEGGYLDAYDAYEGLAGREEGVPPLGPAPPARSDLAELVQSDSTVVTQDILSDALGTITNSDSVETELALSAGGACLEGAPFERQLSRLVTETSSRSLMERVYNAKDVLDDWELASTETLCRHVLLLLAASRCVSCSWLLTFLSRDALLEVLAELLTDERHGLNTYPLMEEKFIQLFADLFCADPSECLGPSLAVYEHIVNIISDWDNLKMTTLVESCVYAMIVLATTNKTVQRRAVAVIERLDVAVWRTGKDRLLEPSLALVAVLGTPPYPFLLCPCSCFLCIYVLYI